MLQLHARRRWMGLNHGRPLWTQMYQSKLFDFTYKKKKLYIMIENLCDIHYLCSCKLLVLQNIKLTKTSIVELNLVVFSAFRVLNLLLCFCIFGTMGVCGSFTHLSWQCWFADGACRPPALDHCRVGMRTPLANWPAHPSSWLQGLNLSVKSRSFSVQSGSLPLLLASLLAMKWPQRATN